MATRWLLLLVVVTYTMVTAMSAPVEGKS